MIARTASILLAATVVAFATGALAQGSAGGSIGKQGKSASGGEDAPAPRASSNGGQTPATGKRCPNITGIWSSWASGLFGASDTNFRPNGTATHKSGIEGTWRCEGGQIWLHWTGSEKHAVRFSADGKKVYRLPDESLVFSRN